MDTDMLRIYRQMREWDAASTLSNSQLLEIWAAIGDFKESISAAESNNMFTLAYQWQDKPHRHVSDLCKILEIVLRKVA